MSDDAVQSLRQIRVLQGASEEGLRWLAEVSRWQDWQPGGWLLGHGDQSRDVYLVTAGRARVVIYSPDGDAVVFQDLRAGSTFGELSALDGGQRSASIEAIEACTTASLTASQFETLLGREPSVAIATMRQMVADIRRLSERIHEFSTLIVQHRVRAELLRLSGHDGQPQGDGVLLTPSPSLSDIAGRISSHREAVSRELSRLAGLGVLRREGSDLRILDIGRLEELVRTAKDG